MENSHKTPVPAASGAGRLKGAVYFLYPILLWMLAGGLLLVMERGGVCTALLTGSIPPLWIRCCLMLPTWAKPPLSFPYYSCFFV